MTSEYNRSMNSSAPPQSSEFLLHRVGIYIISKSRPQNVQKAHDSLSDLTGVCITWVVGEGEKEAYKNAGAKNILEGGSLCKSRNLALEDAFDKNLVCVQLSDDCDFVKWWERSATKDFLHRITWRKAITTTLSLMEEKNYFLGGGSPTTRPQVLIPWQNDGRTYTTHHFILGDFMIIRETDLRFNEEMRLKEDYDYTVQHIKRYGGVLRNLQVLPFFKHRTNEGGVFKERNAELELESISILRLLHPKWFRKSRYKQTEVSLYAPREYHSRPRKVVSS